MIRIFKQIGWLSVVLCILQTSYAQSPTGFNFQGLALTANGTPVLTKKISLRLTLLEGSATGTARYQELHGVNTDAYGQFTVVVGSGQTVTGKFSDLQWNKVAYFLKSEIDIDGATNFVNVGTSQLMSVPYALYANTSGTASVNADSILTDLRAIKLIQKGDSILLNNNRGAVYIQKIDSLTNITKQLAQLKAQYDGTTDSILNLLNKKYDSLAKTISNLNSAPTIPTTSNTASTLKYVSKGLDSVLMPSVYFDGVKTHIALGKIDLLSQKIYNRSFTVEAWVKNLKRSDTSQVIISNGYQSNGNVGAFGMSLIGGRIVATVGNFSGYSTSADFPNDSLWHHIAFQHNNSDKVSTIFIDGAEKYRVNNQGSQGMVNGSVAVDGIGSNLDLGALPPREFFKGNIRKIRVSRGIVYKTDFNPSVKYIKDDSTLAFWELNEGSGVEIKSSDPSYNGILYNGAWQTNDVNTVNNVVDVDGNVYKTVKIGNQIWMAENLKTTKYRDGSKITNVTDFTSWNGLTSGAFCYFRNDSTNNSVLGKLYNYYTVTNSQKLCPSGWHVPTLDEIKILENYLGPDSVSKKLKAIVGYGILEKYNGNNKSGFNAIPAGTRLSWADFHDPEYAYFWLSTEFNTASAYYLRFHGDNTNEVPISTTNKINGMSIRCIKD